MIKLKTKIKFQRFYLSFNFCAIILHVLTNKCLSLAILNLLLLKILASSVKLCKPRQYPKSYKKYFLPREKILEPYGINRRDET